MKIFVKTFGCALNQADSDVIRGVLYKKYRLVNNIKEADIIIVNSCGVKHVTQNRVLSFINSIPKNKKVYVGGCLTKMLDITQQVRVDGLFDTNSITRITDLIEKNKDKVFSENKENRLKKLKVRLSKDIAIIPISQGCLGNCSYCSVKIARGNLKSYKRKDIVDEVRKAVNKGYKKIYLTAQDTGCYGYDIGDNIVKLLDDIIKIKSDFKIRLGMANPQYVKKHIDSLIRIYKSEKMIKFLHIPLQSASNKVLMDMNRQYKLEDFERIVTKFRKEIRGINISTDIIVGYPTETNKDFNKTLIYLRKLKPDVINISKFGSRPRTRASKLKPLTSQEIKRRSIIISRIYKK